MEIDGSKEDEEFKCLMPNLEILKHPISGMSPFQQNWNFLENYSFKIQKTHQNKENEKYYDLTLPINSKVKRYRKSFSPPYEQSEEEVILSISYQLKLIGFSVPEWYVPA